MKKRKTQTKESFVSKLRSLPIELKWLLWLGLITVAALTSLGVRSLIRNEKGDQVIKIGSILPQTGPGAVFAQYIQEGSDLAVEEINARQGKKVKIFYEDSKNLPREGVTVYNKLISTEHPPVIVVALSSVARALAPLAEQSDTAQIYIAV